MNYKDILLFFLVCLLSGICIFVGSVLGNSQGKSGLFAGAVIGGFIGVALAVWLSTLLGLISAQSRTSSLLGGSIGFIVAAVIAVNNLYTPVIPVASVGIIGAGALLGKALAQRRKAR